MALVSLALAALALRRARRSDALVRSLAERVRLLESPAAAATHSAQAPPTPVDDDAFVITRLETHPVDGEVTTPPPAVPIDGRLFADIVAREAVVRAASWTTGVRRALSAESRNRIRFHVRQETRNAGRERRAETKQALREFRARERAAAAAPAPGEDVA